MYKDLNKKINDYVLFDFIGEGSFGKVYKATKMNQTQVYAVKVIQKKLLDYDKSKSAQMHRLLDSQISVMQKCKGEYTIKLFQVIESQQKYYLVLEYCDQLSLQNYIKKEKKIKQPQAIAIVKQIILGITALHNIPAIHRDLKPDNILRKSGKYKIGDFGFSKILKKTEDIMQSFLGTPSYMAPEIIQGKDYDIKVDIWSLGVIFYQMVYGQLPFKFSKQAQNHMMQVLMQPPKYPDTVSKHTQDFIKCCLQLDPDQRLSWQDINNHEILQDDEQVMLATKIVVRASVVGLSIMPSKERTFILQSQKLLAFGQKKTYPAIKSYDNVDKQVIENIKKKQIQIQFHKKQFQKYTKIILKQKFKLMYLIDHIVNIKSEDLINQINKSRRFVQLRLFITYRCMKKAQFLLKFFNKKDNVLSFPSYEAYCKSYQFSELMTDYHIIYKKCVNKYDQISNILHNFQNKFSHIMKDKFKELIQDQSTKTKNLMLTGIQNLDFKIEDHNKFVLGYFSDGLNNFREKILLLKNQNQQLCLFLLTLKYYNFLATSEQSTNDDILEKKISEQTEKIQSIYTKNECKEKVIEILKDILDLKQ